MPVSIGRRQLIAAFGGAAAWPLALRAQQSAMPVIGFLSASSPSNRAHLVNAFRQGIRESGYSESQNVVIDYRWANDQYDRLPDLAAELIRRQVAVIAATDTPAAMAIKAANTTISVVFASGSDPVKEGLVASINRPGGNLTGLTLLTTEIEGKRLGLLRELVPKARLIAVLINPDFPPAQSQRRDVLEAAIRAGLRGIVVAAKQDDEFQPAFAMAIEQRADALIVCADPLFNSRRDQLVALAAQHKMPAIYEFREYALAGGLMSYGVNIVGLYHEVGLYTARILKGAKPSELPVMQPTKFDFIINLKTARALGLEVPLGLTAAADEVIE
jgi:putative ABC transport system substrate-binding protein